MSNSIWRVKINIENKFTFIITFTLRPDNSPSPSSQYTLINKIISMINSVKYLGINLYKKSMILNQKVCGYDNFLVPKSLYKARS